MGPAVFTAGHGVEVRPHPHIGLATVTYLYEGAFMHRDSLGSAQVIRPGDVNWMVAGRGIVHSERTPLALREPDGTARAHGIQTWVALPVAHEEVEPSFAHHPGGHAAGDPQRPARCCESLRARRGGTGLRLACTRRRSTSMQPWSRVQPSTCPTTTNSARRTSRAAN